MVRLKADPGVGGVSYQGQEYPLVKGCVEIPEEAANELLGFGWGFTLAPKQPAPEQEATQADKSSRPRRPCRKKRRQPKAKSSDQRSVQGAHCAPNEGHRRDACVTGSLLTAHC